MDDRESRDSKGYEEPGTILAPGSRGLVGSEFEPYMYMLREPLRTAAGVLEESDDDLIAQSMALLHRRVHHVAARQTLRTGLRRASRVATLLGVRAILRRAVPERADVVDSRDAPLLASGPIDEPNRLQEFGVLQCPADDAPDGRPELPVQQTVHADQVERGAPGLVERQEVLIPAADMISEQHLAILLHDNRAHSYISFFGVRRG